MSLISGSRDSSLIVPTSPWTVRSSKLTIAFLSLLIPARGVYCRAREQPLTQRLGPSRPGGARCAIIAQRDAAFCGQIEQGLALLVLAGEPIEEPSQDQCGQDHLLHHHHAAGDVLV